MSKAGSIVGDGRRYLVKQADEIWDNLGENNLWKRVLKNVVCTTILVAIALIPAAKDAIGAAAYLGAVTTVFGHPGRRFGQMAEALILATSGTALGVMWSTLGVYLGSLVIDSNREAAYAIRAIFFAVVALAHGYLRSKYPRLFIFVLLMIITSTVTLVSTTPKVTVRAVTQIVYPILIAVGIILLVNLCIFPEFSANFLGKTTIETLDETAKALEEAGRYFVAKDFPGKENVNGGAERKHNPNITDDLPNRDGNLDNKNHFTKALLELRLIGSRNKKEKAKANGTMIDTTADQPLTIQTVISTKSKIRDRLKTCKAAQQECNFELAVGVLPPRDVKPISSQIMKRLVANTVAIIGACESKFALIGEDMEDSEPKNNVQQESLPDRASLAKNVPDGPPLTSINESSAQDITETDGRFQLERLKAKREIEFGDAHLLRYLIAAISKPYLDFFGALNATLDEVITCVAYCYNVSKLPSGTQCPKSITLEELDAYAVRIQAALKQFDLDFSTALEGANALENLQNKEPDIMPREEIFLISSFMLNVRQAGTHAADMLEHARQLVSHYNDRGGRIRVYAPRIKWSKWLFSGEEDEAMPNAGRKSARRGEREMHNHQRREPSAFAQDEPIIEGHIDAEKRPESFDQAKVRQNPRAVEESSPILRMRETAADMLDWAQDSEDLTYAFKLSFAVFLVLWPGFVASWNKWYSLNRGLWAALQLIFVLEVSIGTSISTFLVRALGTTLGCLWGWAAVEARGGNRVVCTAMICIGIVPFVYVQVGTKYPKGGMVGIVSICVLAISTELETVPGTPTENFLRRWIAFLIGGVVALLVEVILLPVKARERLVEAVAASLEHIANMEKCIAMGIDDGAKIDIMTADSLKKFEKATGKANSALGAAETILPFCSTEPRLKGSFGDLALVYTEMIFVLHQIVDRMENMIYMRFKYGSGPLEEYNAQLYPYRRNVAGAITLILSSIQLALITKLPLPQFLPSARLAHLRMINRVREVVLESVRSHQQSAVESAATNAADRGERHQLNAESAEEATAKLLRQSAVRRKYLSWNAGSAAQAEIIEFLEELIELAKVVVGAMEFRGGLLSRDLLAAHGDARPDANAGPPAGLDGARSEEEVAVPRDQEEENDRFDTALRTTATQTPNMTQRHGRRRTTRSSSKASFGEEDVPISLKRIQSRKMEAGLRRSRTETR